MDDILYDSLSRYFRSLALSGEASRRDVKGLVFLCAVRRMLYRWMIGADGTREDDYRQVEKALYALFGTSCLLPYPQFCKQKTMDRLHLAPFFALKQKMRLLDKELKEHEEKSFRKYNELRADDANIERKSKLRDKLLDYRVTNLEKDMDETKEKTEAIRQDVDAVMDTKVVMVNEEFLDDVPDIEFNGGQYEPDEPSEEPGEDPGEEPGEEEPGIPEGQSCPVVDKVVYHDPSLEEEESM